MKPAGLKSAGTLFSSPRSEEGKSPGESFQIVGAGTGGNADRRVLKTFQLPSIALAYHCDVANAAILSLPQRHRLA